LDDQPEPKEMQPTLVTQMQPWSRYWARMVDFRLFRLLSLAIPYRRPITPGVYSLLVGLAFLFVWLFVEAALLSTWGTTPGKWLLGVAVRTTAGEKLSYGAAYNAALAFGITDSPVVFHLFRSTQCLLHTER
jgi:uncharacterized RDD family membrane protein YckC